MRYILASLIAVITLSGCATAGRDVTAVYVSPSQFSSLNCEQLRTELQRIASRANQLSGRLDEAASNDKTIAGVGVILFWPALFALGGTKEQEAELSNLKGQAEAIESSLTLKKCR